MPKTPSERQQAEEEGRLLHDRMRVAYPFHPALIDIIRERWTAVGCLSADARHRSAFSCLLYAFLKKNGGGPRRFSGPETFG
jgi:predicted AAA+ superfamily ATPase